MYLKFFEMFAELQGFGMKELTILLMVFHLENALFVVTHFVVNVWYELAGNHLVLYIDLQ